MATYRFDPPLQLRNDPSWTIVSLDEVAELLAAHALAHSDGEAARYRDQIRHCATPEAAANLGTHCEIGPFASAWWLHRCIELAMGGFAAIFPMTTDR